MSRDDTAAASRHRFILDWLTDKPSIGITDITEHCGISEVTARHDLMTLESQGKIRRIRGGAVSLSRSVAITYPEERISFNVDAKRTIGKIAASFVSNGDVIIADIGTTGFYFVQQLVDKRDITIITGDLAIANYASFNLPYANVLLLGGTLRRGHMYVAGAITLDSMSKLYADKAFVSVDGFHPDRGFTVEHDFSVSIKQVYNSNSRQRFMMLDSSKVGKTSFYLSSTLSDFDTVITETDPESVLRHAVEKAHHRPTLIVADEPATFPTAQMQ